MLLRTERRSTSREFLLSMLHRVQPLGLHLRAGPGTQYGIRRVLPRDTAVVARLQFDGGWRAVILSDRTEGWVAERFLEPDATPWLTIAKRLAGLKEIAGPRHEPRIIEFHATTTLAATTDEVSWCSSFINWSMLHVGILGTRMANARSWLSWGVELGRPIPGSIGVKSRGPNPKSGHVGFVTRSDAKRVWLWGGNQGNSICEQSFRLSEFLGFRWPDLPGVDA